MAPAFLVSGFGPFTGVEDNPSRHLAARLARRPPAPWRAHLLELPVEFEAVGRALERRLAEVGACELLLGLGLHRGSALRLERRARARLDSLKPDNTGRRAGELEHLWAALAPAERSTGLDLERLRAALVAAGAEGAYVSQDAGGFVCEHTYYRLLGLGEARGGAALFVHVPPADAAALERQAAWLEVLLGELAVQLGASGAPAAEPSPGGSAASIKPASERPR